MRSVVSAFELEKGFDSCFLFLLAFNFFDLLSISQTSYGFSLLWPVKPGVQVFSKYQDYAGFRDTLILSSRVSLQICTYASS